MAQGYHHAEGRKHKSPFFKMAKLPVKRMDSNQQSSGRLRSSPVFRKKNADHNHHHDLCSSEVTDSTIETSETSSSLLLGSSASAVFELSESSEPLPRQELPPRAFSEGHLSSSTSSLDPPRAKKSVSWSNIVINHHAVVLGDNPSVSSGPPVALGPEVLHMDSISVLEYEASRPPRREKFQMALPRMIREDMLKNEGYGRADFRDAEAEIRKIKKNRQASASATLWEKVRHATKSRRFLHKLKQLEVDNPLVA